MTQQEAQQKIVLSWLKDAHAMEVGAFSTLEDHAAAAEGYPEMQAKLREHLEQTHHHAELIAGCIERLGGQPAAFKETVSSVIGKVAGVANLPAKDTVVKNALGDYAAENFEIACHTSLIAGAESLGDRETAEVFRQLLDDEEKMASWLKGYIPTLTEQYLARVTDAPDAREVLGNLQETAKDLGDKGQRAASDVDSKTTLLASGALLVGAGAALLVGQALRDKSKDRPAQLNMQTDRQTGTQIDAQPDMPMEMQLDAPMSLGESDPVSGLYDGQVTEVVVGSSEPLAADSLLEPIPAATDVELFQSDLDGVSELDAVSDLATEDLAGMYTEAWLTPGPYTGVGPKNGAGAGDATGQEVYSRLAQHGQIDASTVEITVDNGEVLLEGTVDSEETKRLAEEAVESIAGVTKVQNLLQTSATQE